MSPAEIERVRADLDALEWGDVDEEDEEDGGAAALETGEAAATGNGTNAAANALLTRARAASERGVEEAGASTICHAGAARSFVFRGPDGD